MTFHNWLDMLLRRETKPCCDFRMIYSNACTCCSNSTAYCGLPKPIDTSTLFTRHAPPPTMFLLIVLHTHGFSAQGAAGFQRWPTRPLARPLAGQGGPPKGTCWLESSLVGSLHALVRLFNNGAAHVAPSCALVARLAKLAVGPNLTRGELAALARPVPVLFSLWLSAPGRAWDGELLRANTSVCTCSTHTRAPLHERTSI